MTYIEVYENYRRLFRTLEDGAKNPDYVPKLGRYWNWDRTWDTVLWETIAALIILEVPMIFKEGDYLYSMLRRGKIKIETPKTNDDWLLLADLMKNWPEVRQIIVGRQGGSYIILNLRKMQREAKKK